MTLEIRGKCGVCQMEFRRPAAARVPAGYCTACWEGAGLHVAERKALADLQAAFGARHRNTDNDPSAHYRHALQVRIDDEDIARGYVEVKLDPYRVCDVYQVGGGPREQMVKKLLRWTDKGQAEEKVMAEIESALRRWKEMRKEEGLHVE